MGAWWISYLCGRVVGRLEDRCHGGMVDQLCAGGSWAGNCGGH